MTYFKVCLIMVALIVGVAGTVTLTTNTTASSVTYGSSVRFTCAIDPLDTTKLVSFQTPDLTLTDCVGALCFPTVIMSDRYTISPDPDNSKYYIDINSIVVSDATDVRCLHNGQTATITLQVVLGIQSVSLNQPTGNTVTVNANTFSTEFRCVTTAGLPQAIIRWYIDPSTGSNREITPGSSAQITTTTTTDSNSLIVTTGTLRYKPTSADNTGRIFCTAINTQGQTRTSGEKMLNVQHSPTVQPLSTFRAIENKPLSIQCTTTPGNPTQTMYTWTRSIAGGWTQNTKTLTIASVQISDGGTYTCRALNTVGSTTGQFTLEVLYPPRTPTFTYKNRAVTGTFKFIENNPSSVQCVSDSNPSATFTWRRIGSMVSTTASLGLSSIQQGQSSYTYSCTATNTMNPTNQPAESGVKASSLTVDLLFPLSQPLLRYQTTTGTAITGSTIDVVKEDSVTIACVATGNPPPSYTWTNTSRSGQILTINNIQSDITPRCTASSRMNPTYETPVDQSTTASVTVNVMYGPGVPVIRCIHCNPSIILAALLNVIDVRSIHITCGESDSHPLSTYSWSGALTSTTGTLSYNSVSKTQDGDLTCTATNTMTRTFGGVQQGLNNKVVSLNIIYKPTVGNMADEDIVELTSFSKTCPVTPGNPVQTTYRWTRSTGGGWSQTTRTLTIPQVQREDTAVYTCTAQNTMNPTGLPQVTGQDSKTFKLTTKYNPDVEVTTTNTTESADSAEIRCVATGVPAVYTYQQWRQTWIDVTVINHEGGLGNSPTLRLSDLTYQHSGIYTCMVDNGVTGSSNPDAGQGHVYLLVKSKPVITSPVYNNGDHHKLSIGLNDPSSIDLTYYSNAGDTTVTVEHGGQVIGVGAPTPTHIQLPVFTQTVSASGMTVTLNVDIKNHNQFRRYEIVLQNDVNAVKFSLVVAPKQPPEVPTQLTSSDVTETTAELTWVRGFHGGSDQTFVVQLSTDNINWTNKTSILDGQKDSNTSVNIPLNNLSPGTIYIARVYSFNKEGRTQEFSNVNLFTTTAVPAHTSSIGGIIGGIAAGVVVIVLFVVAVVVTRIYDVKLACSCQKKNANSKSTEESKKYYETAIDNKVDTDQATEQVSYYNVGRESEPVPSTYESLSDREPTPNMYSSLQNIEMAPTRNIASDPAVSEPIQSQYESLTERENAPNMYSSLANIESSPDGKVALNPDQVYYNLKV